MLKTCDPYSSHSEVELAFLILTMTVYETHLLNLCDSSTTYVRDIESDVSLGF